MRSSAFPRPASVRGSSVLGSVNWAFVICLFLLLGFVFMWWTAADDRDKAKKERDGLVVDNATRLREGTAVAQELARTAKLFGFNTKSVTFAGETYSAVDLEAAVQHLSTTGEVEVTNLDGSKTKVPGMLNVLRNLLKVTIPVAVRSGDGTGVAKENTKEVDFSWASQGFRTKLKEVTALGGAVPPPPQQPMDKDDSAAMAKYAADLAAYTKALEAYKAAMGQLMGPDFKAEWKQFKETISAVPFDPDTTKAVELNFTPKITGNEVSSFQDLLALFQQPFDSILREFKVNKEADEQVRMKQQGDNKALQGEIESEKKRYDELKTQLEADIAKQRAEVERLTGVASTNETQARQAEQALQAKITETKQELAKLNAQKRALEQRVEGDKERADLEIRRDEVDGKLLAVNGAMDTGTINLGSDDKSYPGLKFVVSFLDRGGARQPIGEVQVIKVTGAHSSQVRVVSATQPLVSGNLISNPLFKADREIHILCLGWTPDLVQKVRLDEMHVVVDAQPSADTDYFVVPDDWKGGAAAPKEGEDAAKAAATNPLDKAKQDALVFGATVITRRMLETFLKL